MSWVRESWPGSLYGMRFAISKTSSQRQPRKPPIPLSSRNLIKGSDGSIFSQCTAFMRRAASAAVVSLGERRRDFKTLPMESITGSSSEALISSSRNDSHGGLVEDEDNISLSGVIVALVEVTVDVSNSRWYSQRGSFLRLRF